MGKFNNFLPFRALFGTIFRVMGFIKIREVRKLARHISIVSCLYFCGETAYLVRFIKL